MTLRTLGPRLMAAAAAAALVAAPCAAAGPFTVLPKTPGPVIVSCDQLPVDAVTAVPAPFDRYVELVCTRSGQALKPVDGYAWVFDVGATWLTSTNPKSPAPTDHYTRLATDPLSDAQVAKLRVELRKLTPNPTLARREFIRLDVTTSWGENKQVYLVLPEKDAPADEVVLGMECIKNCLPIESDPWFFKVMPVAVPASPASPSVPNATDG